MRILIIILFVGWVFSAQAQTSLNTCGSTVKNQSGSVSHSVGQVVYQNRKVSNGYIEQGIQHPYSNNNTITQGIYIPNAFTPDGNGTNEKFEPRGIIIKSYYIKIYNRWGDRIFNGDYAWDGKTREYTVQPGTYTYEITVVTKNKKEKKFNGLITILI